MHLHLHILCIHYCFNKLRVLNIKIEIFRSEQEAVILSAHPLTSCNLVNTPTTLKTVLWTPQMIDIFLNVAFFSIVLILKEQSTGTSESPRTYYKSRRSGPTPDLLNPTLCFEKIPE